MGWHYTHDFTPTDIDLLLREAAIARAGKQPPMAKLTDALERVQRCNHEGGMILSE
jgi:hypothetical protein